MKNSDNTNAQQSQEQPDLDQELASLTPQQRQDLLALQEYEQFMLDWYGEQHDLFLAAVGAR